MVPDLNGFVGRLEELGLDYGMMDSYQRAWLHFHQVHVLELLFASLGEG